MNAFQRIVVVFLLIIGPFVLLELGLRVFGYHLQFPYQDDPELGYRLQPGYQGPGPQLFGIPRGIKLSVNSNGFRGPEFNPIKGPSEYRIVVLGDSCAFGLGLTQNETFSSLLEEILNEQAPANRDFRVINTGVPGYTSYQGLQMLRTRVLDLKPDLIVIYFGWNDHWFSDRSAPDHKSFPEMRDFINQRISKTQGNPLRHLRLYQGMTDLILRFQDETRHKATKPRPAHPVFRVPLDQYEKNIAKMIAIGREHGVDSIALTPPHGFIRGQIPKEYLVPHLMTRDDSLIDLHESYIAATKETALQNGAIVVDMARFFTEGDTQALIEKDGIHPNAAGHRIIAREVAKAIQGEVWTRSDASIIPPAGNTGAVIGHSETIGSPR